MSKVFKGIILVILILFILAISATSILFIMGSGEKLDESKLINYEKSVIICDSLGQTIESANLQNNRRSVLIKNIPQDTINAFIASEDRTFFTHSGLNYKRIIKAAITNIKAKSFKQGASTISQQLIKNTHLTGDKTLKRKLKEINLTRQLERRYTKQQILEMYLNTIYFGHNCYGLQSAANTYFGKNAENLDLAESATLAGLLTSPNNISPFNNEEKCLKRRNLVLKSMYDCNYIDEQTYNKTTQLPINVVQNAGNANNSYYLAVLDELDEITSKKYLPLDGCTIFTYMDKKSQKLLESQAYPCDHSAILTDNGGKVIAFVSNVGNIKRQPASTIKPILVYAPAINEKIIHTITKIDDEQINYNGYQPQNADKKYHGQVTIADCIKDSLNIPAVKVLNSLSINTSCQYAEKLNLPIEDGDKNLNLALGGLTNGFTLKQICDAYTTFTNDGNYMQSAFIDKIIDKDGNIVYKNQAKRQRVFSSGTASLINQMLINTTKSGTAKKLKNLPYDVAAKTGTSGDTTGNTDAYSISYTSQNTLGIWLGSIKNEHLSISGGNSCCSIANDVYSQLYKTNPASLEKYKGTEKVTIDKIQYTQNNKIMLTEPICPKLNTLEFYCLNDNKPFEVCNSFTHPNIVNPTINIKNNGVSILLFQTYYYNYLIKCDNQVVYDDKWTAEFNHVPTAGVHEYSVIPYYFDGKEKHFGSTYFLGKINLKKDNTLSPPPKISDEEWYNY